MIDLLFRGGLRLLTGAQTFWTGASAPDPDKVQVYFANHSSHLDAVLIWSVLPPDLRSKTRPVAARDYWKKYGFRRYLSQKVFRAVLIERTHCTKENHPVKQLCEVLEGGDSLIFFPEGSRGKGEEIGVFKSGLHHLVTRFPDAEYIPVYLENLNRVLPKGEVLPVPLICTLTFGDPLPLIPNEGRSEFLQRAREAVLTLKREL
ncbi:lysophospholipid acyltransferase family protein [Kiritimatiellota bacterium B12222]|nr:lysophospholipid acyltransferase family protein [Kiritimatiellota bacterium B12222]